MLPENWTLIPNNTPPYLHKPWLFSALGVSDGMKTMPKVILFICFICSIELFYCIAIFLYYLIYVPNLFPQISFDQLTQNSIIFVLQCFCVNKKEASNMCCNKIELLSNVILRINPSHRYVQMPKWWYEFIWKINNLLLQNPPLHPVSNLIEKIGIRR